MKMNKPWQVTINFFFAKFIPETKVHKILTNEAITLNFGYDIDTCI